MSRLYPTLILGPAAALSLSGCDGIFSGIYDAPADAPVETVAGNLYIDASDWTEWHYLDLPKIAAAVTADPNFNTSSAWVTLPIPVETTETETEQGCGIYTYWYDVFGAGIGVNEFRSFYPTATQQTPDNWTIAIHRNNVRTNGCAVAATGLRSFDELPQFPGWYDGLDFVTDEWNENDVWVLQDRMLLGQIGCQGIPVNEVLSSWLTIDIPPVPPSFTLDSQVYLLRLPDNTMAALQLVNYQSSAGVKCCLSINYRYPI